MARQVGWGGAVVGELDYARIGVYCLRYPNDYRKGFAMGEVSSRVCVVPVSAPGVYSAGWNIPGCVPDDPESVMVGSWEDCRDYIRGTLQDQADDLSIFWGSSGETDSDGVAFLAGRALGAALADLDDEVHESSFTIYGPGVGDPDHDLGIAYWVERIPGAAFDRFCSDCYTASANGPDDANMVYGSLGQEAATRAGLAALADSGTEVIHLDDDSSFGNYCGCCGYGEVGRVARDLYPVVVCHV